MYKTYNFAIEKEIKNKLLKKDCKMDLEIPVKLYQEKSISSGEIYSVDFESGYFEQEGKMEILLAKMEI